METILTKITFYDIRFALSAGDLSALL